VEQVFVTASSSYLMKNIPVPMKVIAWQKKHLLTKDLIPGVVKRFLFLRMMWLRRRD
jgi:hypothetical protein